MDSVKLSVFYILFLVQSLFAAKITVWNDTFEEITAQIRHRGDKQKTVKVPPLGKESFDNVIYKINEVTINNKKLVFEGGISNKWNATWDGKNLTKGESKARTTKNFITPDENLKYNEVCFLMSHNAHANKAAGYVYAQHQHNIIDQLKHGVRGLMLDTWPAYKDDLQKQAKPGNVPNDKIEVMLWHDITGRNLKIKFSDVLKKIADFLNISIRTLYRRAKYYGLNPD